MTRMLTISILALAVLATTAHAQESLSTTRIEAQHKSLHDLEKKLPLIEANLVKTLQEEALNPTMQAQAVQTLRDLEQLFPSYSFEALLEPLGRKLKDEDADGIVRALVALALDELHSEAGDAVIADLADSSHNKSLQLLCNALLVRSQYK